jgi:hypothetical protein
MFIPRVGTGDGLTGRRGKRGGGIDVAALAAMSPLQRLEHYRNNLTR